MCDQDQNQPFIAPGFDANLHSCQVCNDTGISQETGGYCTSCRIGKRIEQLDQFAEQLKGHGFTEAMRIVYRTTQRTEKAIAASDKALMMARIAKLETQLAERDGYQLVPKEATHEIRKAMHHAYWGSPHLPFHDGSPHLWNAAYAALISVTSSPVSKQG